MPFIFLFFVERLIYNFHRNDSICCVDRFQKSKEFLLITKNSDFIEYTRVAELWLNDLLVIEKSLGKEIERPRGIRDMRSFCSRSVLLLYKFMDKPI